MSAGAAGVPHARWARVVVGALFLASPAVTMRLSPNDYAGGYSRDISNVQQRNSSAIAAIMGEFRTSMADMMFIKTERYLHNGVAYSLHLDLDASTQGESLKSRSSGTTHGDGHEGHGHDPEECDDPDHHHEDLLEHEQEVGATTLMAAPGHEDHDHGEGDEHAGVPTIIRSAENDFRSFVGDLERAVKPWQPASVPHEHTPGTELLPWYRVLTLTDPKNVRGYLIGSWWLAREKSAGSVAESLKFLQEGIANNPDAYQLHLMAGHNLRALGRNAEARRSYRTAADLVMKLRPRDIAANPWWTRYMEEDARAAVRLAVISEKEWGSLPEAVALARRYMGAFEDGDGVLARQIDEMTSAGLTLGQRGT